MRRTLTMLFLLAVAAGAAETKGAITTRMWRQFGVPPALQPFQPGPPLEYLWVAAWYTGTEATHVHFTVTCDNGVVADEDAKIHQQAAVIVVTSPGKGCKILAEPRMDAETFSEEITQ